MELSQDTQMMLSGSFSKEQLGQAASAFFSARGFSTGISSSESEGMITSLHLLQVFYSFLLTLPQEWQVKPDPHFSLVG